MSEDAQPLERSRYPQVVRAVFETPWAILPSYLKAIAELVDLRVAGERLSADDVQARIGSGPATRQPQQAGAVALIPIYGVIMPRATLFSQISGGCSLTTLAAQLQQACDDPQINSILLDVDSPGGSTALVPETAAMIRAANQRKPVTAIANTLAASAGYYLASQAGELYVTPSGYVGSIGVYAAHEDQSGMDEKLGIKTTLVSAGKYKTEGHPSQPLSSEAQAALQSLIDDSYDMFVADVAKGRGVSASAVRDGFGEGRVVTATDALKQGMVDGVATFDTVLQQMLSDSATGSSSGRARADRPLLELGAAAEPAAVEAAADDALDTSEFGDLAGLLRQTSQTLSPEGTESR